MKSTRAFKILSIALAAAVVFYFLVQGVRYLTNPYATTRVYTSTTEESVEASGWLVREEEAFRSEAGTLSHTRDEGEKVGKGQVIATAYDSPGALEAVAQIQAKRLQLEQLEYALSSYLNPDAALKLDGSISDEIMTLRKNLTGGDYTVSVSRKGGYVVRALSQRAPVRSAITVDAALEKAAEFLAAHGCRGMKESYHILKDHVLTVTYCAEQNGVMCYPDMVKLAVAMDTGEMLRFDAEAYLTSHAERDLPEPAVSEEDARAMAGEGLTVQSEKLAVIPTSGAEEIYCRELICETEDGRHYLLYVNAMTGAQEKILILLEDESGTLAL